MGSVLAFIIFPTALAVLVVSANYFLDAVQKIGVALGIRPFIMGLFIVAFGTSFPEAAISVSSVLDGFVDVPVAQVIGSNIANILLVLGVAALLARRFIIGRHLIGVELPLTIASVVLFVFIVFDGEVHFFEGLMLFVGFVLYAIYIFRSKDNLSYSVTVQEQLRGFLGIPKEILLFITTVVFIAIASHFVIVSTVSIAALFSVPESVVAVTALAFGTSLPELVVSVQAVLRNEIELVIGSVVGSNILNILFVVGISALFSTLTVSPMLLSVGIPALVGATALFVISCLLGRIHAWVALLYILLYVVFIVSIIGLS